MYRSPRICTNSRSRISSRISMIVPKADQSDQQYDTCQHWYDRLSPLSLRNNVLSFHFHFTLNNEKQKEEGWIEPSDKTVPCLHCHTNTTTFYLYQHLIQCVGIIQHNTGNQIQMTPHSHKEYPLYHLYQSKRLEFPASNQSSNRNLKGKITSLSYYTNNVLSFNFH